MSKHFFIQFVGRTRDELGNATTAFTGGLLAFKPVVEDMYRHRRRHMHCPGIGLAFNMNSPWNTLSTTKQQLTIYKRSNDPGQDRASSQTKIQPTKGECERSFLCTDKVLGAKSLCCHEEEGSGWGGGLGAGGKRTNCRR